MQISFLSSRGTLVNFSLQVAGNTGARGRFVLPIRTVWARIYCVHLILCVRLMLEGLTADTNRCIYPS